MGLDKSSRFESMIDFFNHEGHEMHEIKGPGIKLCDQFLDPVLDPAFDRILD